MFPTCLRSQPFIVSNEKVRTHLAHEVKDVTFTSDFIVRIDMVYSGYQKLVFHRGFDRFIYHKIRSIMLLLSILMKLEHDTIMKLTTDVKGIRKTKVILGIYAVICTFGILSMKDGIHTGIECLSCSKCLFSVYVI